MLLVKSSENNFISLPAFYLSIWCMIASKHFEKNSYFVNMRADSLGSVKTHFGKLAISFFFSTDIMS
jgi:hypothetical protein